MEVTTESEVISSVRSTISTASSGYAIVTGPRKKPRKSLSDSSTYYEPPPDYDQPAIFAERNVPYMTQQPLLPKPQLSSSAASQHDASQQPFLHNTSSSSAGGQKAETRVRLNSLHQDITIEVIQHGVTTPTPSNRSFSPPSSSKDDRQFFPARQDAGGTSESCCCKCCVLRTRKEKCLCVALFLMTMILVVAISVIVYFASNSWGIS